MKTTLYRLAVVLLALVLLISGGYILWKQLDYQKGARSYEAAARTAGIPQYIHAPEKTEEDGESEPLEVLLSGVDLAALRETNPDAAAWIVIPDTVLSYPVVQGSDNTYYLNHTWTKERSAVGAVFMECTCAPDFSGFHTILYGHRMNNESMFGVLKSYENEDFWREHPAVYVTTDDGSYGRSGMVTQTIKDLVEEGKHYDVCVAIGPMIMMKFVCKMTEELGIPTVVSLNPIMVDGTGMCGACRVTVDGKVKFACVDGPEFDGHKVDFDQAMKRQQIYKTAEGRAVLKEKEGSTHHGGCGNCG